MRWLAAVDDMPSSESLIYCLGRDAAARYGGGMRRLRYPAPMGFAPAEQVYDHQRHDLCACG
jgi:hypothetical protein